MIFDRQQQHLLLEGKEYTPEDIARFIAEGADAPSAPIEMNSTGADTNGTFENAANNNFKLLINDLKNVAGDPRWW